MSSTDEKTVSAEHHAKDYAGKYLEEYPDVFADISNVLILGEPLIQEDQLTSGPTESIYKAEDGKQLKEQRRDITKYVQDLGTTVSLVGFDNQSDVDEDMAIRVMGYDYASYRNQIVNGKERYPVITAVLYFGDKRWTKPKSLKKIFEKDNSYAKYASDYKIRVIDVPRIPKRIREQLTSDFREVAEFFANRKKKNYKPSTKTLDHVEAVLKLFEVFTRDTRYKEIETEVLQDVKKGVKFSMCEFAERIERKGISQGIAQERENSIKSIVKGFRNCNISDENIIFQLKELYSLSPTIARKYLR